MFRKNRHLYVFVLFLLVCGLVAFGAFQATSAPAQPAKHTISVSAGDSISVSGTKIICIIRNSSSLGRQILCGESRGGMAGSYATILSEKWVMVGYYPTETGPSRIVYMRLQHIETP